MMEAKRRLGGSLQPSMILLVLSALLVASCGGSEVGNGGGDANGSTVEGAANDSTLGGDRPEIPEVEVEFGHEPYFDHTQAIIGLDNGWFEEVGITIAPDGEGIVVDGNQAISIFASGRLDVLSGSAQLLMPAVDQIPPFKMFFFADIFQGYALMAQPDGNYQSFEEFVDSGMEPDEAFEAAVGQMEGQTFAYPPEAAIQGFVELMLDRGGLTLDDMETNVAEDSANVALMQSGRADFQVGGVPSRLTLETAGFKPILTSGDLAQYAEASPESEELRAVFHDGWLATDEWLEENWDTALRLASVGFRVNAYINEDPEGAARIHTPFLNSVAGTDFEVETALVTYSTLHPFLTFEEQEQWHLDDSNPLNGQYVIESAIRSHVEQGTFEEGQYSSFEDFSVAHELYKEMTELRDEAEELIQAAEANTNISTEAQALLDEARRHFDNYNFLDAQRFAQAANG